MLVRRNDDQDICTRYRPRKLSEVVGNMNQIKTIKSVFDQGETRPKVMCFIGTHGTGKTTVARILAAGLNCEKGDTTEPCLECKNCKAVLNDQAFFVNEVNCGKYSNKGDMFNISELLYSNSFEGRNKCIILDEAGRINKAGQNLLLKDFEEVPKNTYVFLCTSQPERFDKALFDRFDTYRFQNPNASEIKSVAKDICKQEDWDFLNEQSDMNKFVDKVLGQSFRKTVKSIEKVFHGGLESLESQDIEGDSEMFDYVKRVFNGVDYTTIAKEIKKHSGFDHESFRMIARAYAETALINTGMKNISKSESLTQVIETLETPYYEIQTPKFFRDLFYVCVFIKSGSV